MNPLKNFLFISVTIVFLALLNGCQDICNCPAVIEGTVRLRLTINDENPRVFINVYRGSVEKGELLVSDTISDTSVSYVLPAPANYSATATYVRGDDTVIAINGGRLSVTTDECDCEEAQTLRLNLRLAR